MFGMLSPKFAETKTDKWGRFALAFDGGTQIKSLTVDGHAPQRATRKTRDQEDVDVPADVLNAGAFNLTLVRQKKFLGIW